MVDSWQELDTDFLFVYGTLRRGFALHHHLSWRVILCQALWKVPEREIPPEKYAN
jgi:gamma-glutamylcyclotransferase (GGCT)/AIG2-like uncharacterized protein YtfP